MLLDISNNGRELDCIASRNGEPESDRPQTEIVEED